MRDFKKLRVWRESIELVKLTYNTTKNNPKEEIFGLTSQIKKTAISISSNIAEGAGRKSNKDFSHFLDMATGSCFELETQMIIANELTFISKDQLEVVANKIEYIEKMIYKLASTLQ